MIDPEFYIRELWTGDDTVHKSYSMGRMIVPDHGACVLNPTARQHNVALVASKATDPLAFHRQLAGYSPSPLVRLPWASDLYDVYLKHEYSRFGLPAFKILGASWASHLVLCDRFSLDPATTSVVELQDALRAHEAPITLFAATEGNHGRAVARTAKLLGLKSRIFVPALVAPASRQLIASEGADVVQVDGSYDHAVEQVAAAADREDGVLVQDSSWDGYEDVPLKIVSGYSTLFNEMDAQLAALPAAKSPDVVIVPLGVGSLAHAALAHFRSPSRPAPDRPFVVTVEPTTAGCFFTSLREGKSTTIDAGHTVMPGLCCGTVSPVSWPDLKAGVDAAVVVDDEHVLDAMNDLIGKSELDVGPCGAAALTALRALVEAGQAEAIGLRDGALVVLLCTEGGEVYRHTQSCNLHETR